MCKRSEIKSKTQLTAQAERGDPLSEKIYRQTGSPAIEPETSKVAHNLFDRSLCSQSV